MAGTLFTFIQEMPIRFHDSPFRIELCDSFLPAMLDYTNVEAKYEGLDDAYILFHKVENADDIFVYLDQKKEENPDKEFTFYTLVHFIPGLAFTIVGEVSEQMTSHVQELMTKVNPYSLGAFRVIKEE